MKTTRMVMVVLAVLAGCAKDDPKQRTYDNNDLELIAPQAAIQTCSCRFVMGMDEAYCREWVRVSPNLSRFSVDTVKKTVEASAFISWTAKARYVDDKRGCVLE
jgi:hypothetical protein